MKSTSKRYFVDSDRIVQNCAESDIGLTVRTFPFLVATLGSCQTADELHLILEYVPGASLFKHLPESGYFPESRAKFYTAELIIGLNTLPGFVHRDLRP
jgi:serine/threonine protein kinase